MKLNIPYDKYNSKNTILDTLRKYKNSPSSYFLVNYFISIFEALVSTNFAIFNYIFNVLNQIPEIIIVLFCLHLYLFRKTKNISRKKI